ncbi:MAG: hypothetical protein FD187_3174, partial [bacterium]
TPTPELPAVSITMPPEPSKLPALNTATEPPAVTVPTAAAVPVCPKAAASEPLFTFVLSTEPFRLCFLYPADFTAKYSENLNGYLFSGTPYGTGEKLAGSVSLGYQPAGGKTLEQYAADTTAAQAPGLGLALIPLTLGADVPAIRVDGIPGMVGTVTLFIVHNDTAFTLTFLPADTIPEAVADMLRLYASLTASWVFTR